MGNNLVLRHYARPRLGYLTKTNLITFQTDSNEIQTHNHLVHNHTLNHLAKLA